MIRSMKNYSDCYEHVPKWNDGLRPTSQPSPLPWLHIRSSAASVCFCCIFSICSSWVSIKRSKFPPSYFDVGIITVLKKKQNFAFQVSDFWCFGYSVVSATIKSGFRIADKWMQERIHTTKWSYNALLWGLTCNFYKIMLFYELFGTAYHKAGLAVLLPCVSIASCLH